MVELGWVPYSVTSGWHDRLDGLVEDPEVWQRHPRRSIRELRDQSDTEEEKSCRGTAV